MNCVDQMKARDVKRGRTFVAESPIHGLGLFAAEPIRPTTLLGRFEGKRTTRDGGNVLWVRSSDGSWNGIDVRNDLRFVNHSDKPNAIFEGVELWSLRTIREGEEITLHYGGEVES